MFVASFVTSVRIVLDEQSQAQGLGRVKRKFRASLAVALEATGSARDPLRRLRRHRPPPIRTLRSSCMDDEMIVEEEGEHYGSSVRAAGSLLRST